jgi:predicted metalloprotease
MGRGLRRAVLGLAVGAVLAGCSVPVVGTASPGRGEPVDVTAAQLPITAAVPGPVDQMVRNALTDLTTFWSTAYPQNFGKPFRPLKGGYFSVDAHHVDENAYPTTGIGCAAQSIDPKATKGNAFYNPRCDAIAYDRTLLANLAEHAGRALVPIVLAHEFGHAMQDRFGFAADGRSIEDETQADCLAGAWTAWVVAGHAQHVAIRKPDLDDVLTGYLRLSDPIGSDPDDTQAHGSYFDRLAAFSDGYDKGVPTCRDDFGPDRVFTQSQFTSDADFANQGNAPYSDLQQLMSTSFPEFWKKEFPATFGKQFTTPQLEPFSGKPPSQCGNQDLELVYCQKGPLVGYDEPDLTKPAYDIGDYAVVTAVAIPYGLDARDQLGRSAHDSAAYRSSVCLAGWFSAAVSAGQLTSVTISPGDLDESVQFLLKYGQDPKVLPGVDQSGFQLVDTFRKGFLQGAPACDVGA